ncbi:GGDEF domain-containing protein [Mycolicibacterium sp. P1-18]|uniref:putative bifunctional diguanylate cyclase/phosphodiesterase n=1 Tax=Mycolicibacterium sp. P1-18 TaxID=2024615 RepID=UPI0011F2E895|nr:bifunctional diguanylate cyclase/phosphodiesterase [Mycolicibacterium sp. P1-18]KAA0099594.1 GGDEF domain-containing protein [Mycolicibacterium sp. P1-18]
MSLHPGRTQWAIFGVAAAAIVVNAAAPWSLAASNRLDNALQLTAGLVAAVTALLYGLRRSGPDRTWRLLMAGGMALWSVGMAFWAYYQVIGGEGLPSPSWADVGFLSYPFLALPAMLMFSRRAGDVGVEPKPWTHRLNVGLILDGLIVTASLFFLSWSGALRAVVASGGPDPVSTAVAMAYPVTDLLLVVVAVLMVVFGQIKESDHTSFLLLTGGVAALAVSDSIYAYLIAIGADYMGPLSDAGFILGPLLFAFAVSSGTSRSDDRLGPAVGNAELWQVGLPYVCLVAVGLVVVVQLVTHQPDSAVGTATGMVVVALVVIRQLVHVSDNRALLREVYASQQRLAHHAHHDSLTGLANRLSLSTKLDLLIEQRRPATVVLIDVDDFKQVNDQYGHAAGDRLLCEVGQRLVDVAQPHGTVARFGGDEFVILVDGEAASAADLVARVRTVLTAPFSIADAAVNVHVSMGVVVANVDEPFVDHDVLFGRADTAMYASKRSGKDTAVIYRPAIGQAPDFSAALRDAGGDKPAGFCMVYQPVLRLDDGVIVALEALARWKALDGSDVEPSLFIPSTERAGLGRVLDAMVVNVVCSDVAEYQVRWPVHVNVGASRLGDRDFEEIVVDAVRAHGLTPGQMTLEVTETEAVSNLADGAAAIKRLQAQGVRVALDDFGTGYNSLTYLHELPVDVIKLDRSLTTWLQPDREATLYRSLVTMCARLGLDVIAEGVETEEQLRVIRELGCRYGQGFHLGRPMELGALLQGQPS